MCRLNKRWLHISQYDRGPIELAVNNTAPLYVLKYTVSTSFLSLCNHSLGQSYKLQYFKNMPRKLQYVLQWGWFQSGFCGHCLLSSLKEVVTLRSLTYQAVTVAVCFFFNQQLVLPVLTIADKNSALNPFTHVQVKLGQDVTRRWWLCGRGWKKKADKRQTEASVSVTRVGLRLFNNLFLLIKPQKLKATLVGFFYLLTHVNWRGGGKQHPRTRMLTLIAHSGRTSYPSAARGSISLSFLHTNTF